MYSFKKKPYIIVECLGRVHSSDSSLLAMTMKMLNRCGCQCITPESASRRFPSSRIWQERHTTPSKCSTFWKYLWLQTDGDIVRDLACLPHQPIPVLICQVKEGNIMLKSNMECACISANIRSLTSLALLLHNKMTKMTKNQSNRSQKKKENVLKPWKETLRNDNMVWNWQVKW